MYPLFESICVRDGVIQHVEWHQRRYERSYKELYGVQPVEQLIRDIEVPVDCESGLYKLRIAYNEKDREVVFSKYQVKIIESLKLVNGDDIDYSLKYANREGLNQLFKERDSHDDILIVKHDLITDTSYANIIFFDGVEWCTPSSVLLDGTARARLIYEGRLKVVDVKVGDIERYTSFKLINALRDIDEVEESSVENIYL